MSAYAALTGAGFRAQVRDKATLFFTFAFPLLFLVVFGLIFRGQEVAETGRPYISYIAPGVMSWGVANAAVFGVAFTLMQWRRDDLLRLIRMTPTRLPAVLASRYVLALAVGAVQAVVFVAVAMLPLFGLELDARWPLALPVLVLGITAFLTIGVVIGSYADTPEAVAAIANFLMVPMAFLSGSFLPLDMMPSWLQAVSRVLPLRYLNDAVSAALSGAADSTTSRSAAGADRLHRPLRRARAEDVPLEQQDMTASTTGGRSTHTDTDTGSATSTTANSTDGVPLEYGTGSSPALARRAARPGRRSRGGPPRRRRCPRRPRPRRRRRR